MMKYDEVGQSHHGPWLPASLSFPVGSSKLARSNVHGAVWVAGVRRRCRGAGVKVLRPGQQLVWAQVLESAVCGALRVLE